LHIFCYALTIIERAAIRALTDDLALAKDLTLTIIFTSLKIIQQIMKSFFIWILVFYQGII
ncbi:hypothetical protein, partial [Streptococcus suis]|uniref:hypothetical protein n=1 Tax=Streptococcus suis TaxID=1307 RepID=UPI001EDD5877